PTPTPDQARKSSRPNATANFPPRDPIGTNQYADGMNLYEYVRSGPVDGLDPTGHERGQWLAKKKLYMTPNVHSSSTGMFYGSLWENQAKRKDSCGLYISFKLKFFFGTYVKGKKRGEDPIEATGWTSAQRSAFIKKWKDIVQKAWSEKYEIVPKPGQAKAKCKCACGTQVMIDWEMSEIEDITNKKDRSRKKDEWLVAVLRRTSGGDVAVNGDNHRVQIDPSANNPRVAHTKMALAGAVKAGEDPKEYDHRNVKPPTLSEHEFGHMIGLVDEYMMRGGPWLTDRPSMMNIGNSVRPRHYIPFAMWMNTHTPGKCKYVVKGKNGKLWDLKAAKQDILIGDDGSESVGSPFEAYKYKKLHNIDKR
ncbi:MAG: hypothetical protein H8E73_09170, partial [Planctomycetes bacterium]|nr:hypothetical protein [Planctomycetota bacterium]